MSKTLEEGMKAPAFRLPTDGGGAVSNKDFLGAALVLYFYPKDDTPSCTREAIDFSAKAAAFQRAGAAILGVSKDSVRAHDKFKEKHALKLALGADESGETVEAYGVWGEKTLYGRTYMGIERATFLIDAKGVIRGMWRKVRVPGHVEAVLAAVKAL